jgi:hypothetical protein
MTTSLLSGQHARTSRFAKFSRYHQRQRYRAVKRCIPRLSISGKLESGIALPDTAFNRFASARGELTPPVFAAATPVLAAFSALMHKI